MWNRNRKLAEKLSEIDLGRKLLQAREFLLAPEDKGWRPATMSFWCTKMTYVYLVHTGMKQEMIP